MVWFQCDDCGENLKKPKLASHFNRCSAHKLSCIDCGVVFDQHSVQAHTSCVSEVEKYGPKGLNKAANPAATNPKNGKAQSGPEVDLSRGLSQRPPWMCSLCNVKATSREALDLHAQGKKHRSRSKAAAAKDTASVDAKNVKVDTMEVDNNSAAVGKGVVEVPHVDTSSQLPEKKRKNEQLDGAGENEGELKATRRDKKAKKESPTSDVDDKDQENVADSTCKKRKHVEEEQETTTGHELKGNGKKSKKKEKLSESGENGHTSEKNQVAADASPTDQEERKKDKKAKKGKRLQEEALNGNCSPPVADEDTNEVVAMNGTLSVHDPESRGDSSVSPVNGKKVKKGKGASLTEDLVTPEPVKSSQEDKSKSGRKEKHKKSESKAGSKDETPRKEKEKESIVHEVSFREWLREDDNGGNGGTPTHPPMVDKSGEETPTEPADVDNEHTQAVSKVVKWKKIISEALLKSPDGRMKKKDLSKAILALALKAAESSTIPLDKIILKEELMRQINRNPKFVLDGEHVMLAPRAK
ncbi:cell growth-regulating nucleolar protein [Marchantia polymorpha subsp. ruderalis]|uniref:Uncharacterized protein n=2 Tax=Marchantia polymorpha TaxID=3197 RepID=A0A176W1C0_MARPO|nr:hypothetical protein AXG93_4360s1130 [Marchantia polymorpha subsp. ruderalis]PTQ31668.1 hypothetical protein MARPO_0108s0017 [Marchantia polymorpha]BBN19820.1 hypothetical protein Mp_8g13930 [Marchantia polymorpha subsp. ruderalis]|eukprot:PTQ31668.1 hypothetical protein MARPO_0108s0017 [Marchantia polymorpha]